MTAFEPDTDDLRTGPEIHIDLLALLPLVGTWQGTGRAVRLDGEFDVELRIRFTHDGRAQLGYEARARVPNDDGDPTGTAWRETGFWRVGTGQDDIEAVIATSAGSVLVFAGLAADQQWDLATEAVAGTPSAGEPDAQRRFYALRDDTLYCATERAVGVVWTPALNARLERVRATARPDAR